MPKIGIRCYLCHPPCNKLLHPRNRIWPQKNGRSPAKNTQKKPERDGFLGTLGIPAPMTSIFEGQPPQNKAFSHQNKGHLGSRYIYIYINHVYITSQTQQSQQNPHTEPESPRSYSTLVLEISPRHHRLTWARNSGVDGGWLAKGRLGWDFALVKRCLEVGVLQVSYPPWN